MVFLNFRFKKDYRYRILFFKYEFLKSLLKFLISSKYFLPARMYFTLLLLNITRFSSISFIKNRCLISGTTRSVFRFFRLSRWEIKKLGVASEILGVKKSSW